ncbi:hypothetical protein CVT26_009120 [Gymnopilus dilepis]|uniref:Uncharacterized protein n=1 Tax=Gymnopilus dilepis TaxID=231916 RepID=A0A409YRI2_9AGAR|nr:hypothetical protein CVT26_009120 [Gymnopilus dilepis]
MPETVVMQHAPAMKVGGRRLSVSARHKPPHPAEPPKTERATSEPADYPRPAPPPGANTAAETDTSPPSNNVINNNPPPHHEDEVPPPKKERVEKKMEELAHRKAEMTRPTRDVHAASRASGQNMRIGQPAGKGLGL